MSLHNAHVRELKWLAFKGTAEQDAVLFNDYINEELGLDAYYDPAVMLDDEWAIDQEPSPFDCF